MYLTLILKLKKATCFGTAKQFLIQIESDSPHFILIAALFLKTITQNSSLSVN
jgi:hypothetical protein